MPPHINAAELEIRDSVVLHRNVRHQLSEPEGRAVFSVLVSVARTCYKRGIFPRIAVEELAKDPDWSIFKPPDGRSPPCWPLGVRSRHRHRPPVPAWTRSGPHTKNSGKPLNHHRRKLQPLTVVTKSIDIKAPIDSVFTYFARPEHVSDQLKTDMVGMTVVPMDIKEGMGVGTTFRIIGNFGGKRLEWDCETVEFEKEERISAKQIDGPFKRWIIVNEFEARGDNLTRVTMTVDYEMPFGPLGSIMDKAKFAKSAERGMETALYNVRGLLEGNGSIPVYITLDAYRKLLAEKKKMNNLPVSTVLTAILERYDAIETTIKN